MLKTVFVQQDLTYIARVLRIPAFDSEQMDLLRKKFAQIQGQERSKRKKQSSQEIESAAAVALGKLTHHADEDPVHQALDEWIGYQRRLIAGHILNRKTWSKRPDGKPISDLPPYENRFIFCELRPDEMEVQKTLADELLEGEVAAAAGRVRVSRSHCILRYCRRGGRGPGSGTHPLCGQRAWGAPDRGHRATMWHARATPAWH